MLRFPAEAQRSRLLLEGPLDSAPTVQDAHDLDARGSFAIEDDVRADGEAAQARPQLFRRRPAAGCAASMAKVISKASSSRSAAGGFAGRT